MMRLLSEDHVIRIGLAGSGYISAGLLRVLSRYDDVTVTAVLTGRHTSQDHEYPRPELLVRNVEDLIAHSDLIVECSGGVTRAMSVVAAAFAAGIPVVSVNSEFQVTVGHLFAPHGVLTEAEGDQPGALAALHEEVTLMGFQPLVYGNVKTFLQHDPTVENMRHQASLHGISQQQVTSFTDGTKLHLELALVANGLDAGLAPGGVIGVRSSRFEDCAAELATAGSGGPISDFCMPTDTDAHIFIVATHPDPVSGELAHYKLGPGPYYRFSRNRHLGHFEVPRTIKRVVETGRPLINNGTAPTSKVVAVAKKPVTAGTSVTSAVGSTLFRGVAVHTTDHADLLPIGLMEGCTVVRDVAPGAYVTTEDVRLGDALAAQLCAWPCDQANEKEQ
jgi:predicted homoserine dehydrogenase-like protein